MIVVVVDRNPVVVDEDHVDLFGITRIFGCLVSEGGINKVHEIKPPVGVNEKGDVAKVKVEDDKIVAVKKYDVDAIMIKSEKCVKDDKMPFKVDGSYLYIGAEKYEKHKEVIESISMYTTYI